MKPVALFLVVALVPAASLVAQAKTVRATQDSANEKSVSGVAGPTAAARNSGPSQTASQTDQYSTRHSGKKALKKAKVSSPPPMHDPN